MIIHDDIRALRDDPVRQRAARSIMEDAAQAWRGDPSVAPVLDAFDAFADGRTFADCDALAALFDDRDHSAAMLVRSLTDAFDAALGACPLGHVPFRHAADGPAAVLVLAQSGPASLSLVALDGKRMAATAHGPTVDFQPCEVWQRTLAGAARARMFAFDDSAGRLSPASRELALAPGSALYRDGRREALHIETVDGCLVTLRLRRRCGGQDPAREFRIADGALVRQSAGNPGDSRTEALMALAGRMQRRDAAPAMANIALSDAGSALRWQALRECLALDTEAGFAALCAVAARLADPLADPARALRDQLTARHPQLAELLSCPA